MNDRDLEILTRMALEASALEHAPLHAVSGRAACPGLPALIAASRMSPPRLPADVDAHVQTCAACRARWNALCGRSPALHRGARRTGQWLTVAAACAASIFAALAWRAAMPPSTVVSTNHKVVNVARPTHRPPATRDSRQARLAALRLLMPDNPHPAPSSMAGREACTMCDANCDGVVNMLDVEAFMLALLKPDAYSREFAGCESGCRNDINCDGVVNRLDIEPFLACLLGS